MELKPVSFLVLGMVRFGATSGYAIKKAADAATLSFWPTSLSQIYPELARLEEAGLLSRRDDPRGARARAAYELTAAGEEALLTWLRSPVEEPPRMRYEGLLRAFFSDALPLAEQLAALRGRRQQLLDLAARLFESDLTAAGEAIEAAGMTYPVALAEWAARGLAFTIEWMGKLEAQLEEELGAGTAKGTE